MSDEREAKALATAAKGFRKAQTERAYIAGKCWTRAKRGDGTWGELLASGEETLVGLLASQAFAAGYALACKHLVAAGDATGGMRDIAQQTRGTYTSRELDAMSKEERA